jgi:hypothetical protein
MAVAAIHSLELHIRAVNIGLRVVGSVETLPGIEPGQRGVTVAVAVAAAGALSEVPTEVSGAEIDLSNGVDV